MDNGIMDMAAFDELKTIMGDTFNEVIQMYLQNMPDLLNDLQTQIKNQDANQVFEIAHRIKSSSSSIGATGIANNAEIIEQIGRAGSTENTLASLEDLNQQYNQAKLFLSDEING